MPASPSLRHPELQQLLEYWRGKRNARPVPTRSSFDPVEIPSLLPHLMLTEAVEGGEDFRYRVVGTAVVEAAGMDFTGRRQQELLPPGPYRDYVLGLSQTVMREQRPLYSESSYRCQLLSDRWTSRLMLPLAREDGTIGFILAGQVFGARPLAPPGRPIVESDAFEAGPSQLLD
jgi:hypothetical protein